MSEVLVIFTHIIHWEGWDLAASGTRNNVGSISYTQQPRNAAM